MVGDGLDVVEDVAVEVLARLPVVARALDDVEQVRDHTGSGEGLAVVVEVDAPRVAGAPGEHLEPVCGRVVAPDPRVELGAVGVRGAGLADL